MLDFNLAELMVVAVVALLVIGPKDLPKAMRFVGHWVGKARGVARQFRSGFDAMVREAELAEMEKKWKAENERIMREHPPEPSLPQSSLAQSSLPQSSLPAPPASADGDDGPVMTAQPVILPDAPAPTPAAAGPAVADEAGDAAAPERKPEP
jgi:sec-independent protein translocase protein TatB